MVPLIYTIRLRLMHVCTIEMKHNQLLKQKFTFTLKSTKVSNILYPNAMIMVLCYTTLHYTTLHITLLSVDYEHLPMEYDPKITGGLFREYLKCT